MYKNNEFSISFIKNAIRGISYLKALGRECAWDDWENIVSKGMKAIRRKSNTGLTDVYNDITAWSAKKTNVKDPEHIKSVNLISGRINLNHIKFEDSIFNTDPNIVGKKIIEIWNNRVLEAGVKYNDIRTIVLMITPEMDKISFYEEETSLYNAEDYQWTWTRKKVLNGIDKKTGKKKFAWCSSGTQFTIVSNIPSKRVYSELPPIRKIDDETKTKILESVGFDFNNATIKFLI